jgi:methionyl-tRNA formyltransferase
MKLDQLNQIILLGGSRITAELASHIRENTSFQLEVFTAPRQLDDVIYGDGTTLKSYLESNEIPFHVTEDINTFEPFLQSITPQTLAIGLGEAWSFHKKIIDQFDGRLVDLMGIRLPQYRGGAHYTWQILRGNRIGACNLQVINEDMVQGVYDSGEILAFKEYFFPTEARTPEDYFNHAVKEEIAFITLFIDECLEGKEIKPFPLQENFSMYFPRLHTLKNAYIDWSWDTDEIDRFICAFDKPYPGAGTQLDGEDVRLRGSRVETNDGPFHPFQNGLVYKVYNQHVYVCTRQGSLILSEVIDQDGNNIIGSVRTGNRFHTPNDLLEKGLTTKIEY